MELIYIIKVFAIRGTSSLALSYFTFINSQYFAFDYKQTQLRFTYLTIIEQLINLIR